MAKASDRRTARTRHALRQALIALLSDKHYNDISIQEITDYANVGRTTFYLHYASKDALFLDIHGGAFQEHLGAGSSRQVWLGEQPSPQLVEFFREMKLRGRPVTMLPEPPASESTILLNTLQRQLVESLTTNLRKNFDETTSRVPFPLLAEAMSGVQIWLVRWWVGKRNNLSADELAKIVHLLQRGMLRDALHLCE